MNTENHQNDGRNLPIDYRAIIDYYYGEGDSELKSLLLTHSRDVADKALRICDKHPELRLDRDFVEAAAMFAVGATHAASRPFTLGKCRHTRYHHRNRQHHTDQTLHIHLPLWKYPDLRSRRTIPRTILCRRGFPPAMVTV